MLERPDKYKQSNLLWITALKSFVTMSLGVNLIKLFGVNLLTVFCKLDLFISMHQLMFVLYNGRAYAKVRVNLHKNSFMKSTFD